MSNFRSAMRREKGKITKLCRKLDLLCMFLDGLGGSGKSEVLKEVLKYGKEFCENIGVPFTKETILITASTGVAATLIKGSTIHAAAYIFKKKVELDHIDEFRKVRLLIIDEISMISSKMLCKIDKKLRQLKDPNEFYGGINIVFVGDFRQLEPVDKASGPIFKESIPEWYDAINTYIKLEGRYRFLKDPDYGDILDRFHQGCPLPSDFDTINRRVVKSNGKTIDGDELPEGIRYCTPNNKERDAINCGLFYNRIKECSEDNILILDSNLKILKNVKEKMEYNSTSTNLLSILWRE